MVLTEQMTLILFKLLNFVLLVALIVYATMIYLLPDLKKQMEKYISYIASLRNSHRSLLKDARMLHKGMNEDLREQAELREKVKRWRIAVQRERDALLDERERRKKELLKQFQEHREDISLYRTYKKVAPEAIERARKELEKLFAREKVQQRFIKKIMHDLYT